MSNVPVVQSVRAAWSFRGLYWRRVAGVLAAVAAANFLANIGQVFTPGRPSALDLLGLVAVPLAISAYAGLMRLAFSDEHPGDVEFQIGTHGFQWGQPEWRYLSVLLVLALLAFLGACVFVFLAILFIGGAALQAVLAGGVEGLQNAPPQIRATLQILQLMFLLGLFVVSTKLSLAPAATIAEKRIVISKSWVLTRGEFWRIAAAQLLATVVPFFAASVLGAVLAGLVAAGGQPKIGALVAIAVASAVSAFVVTPVSVGLSAYLYRGLRPPEDVPNPKQDIQQRPLLEQGES